MPGWSPEIANEFIRLAESHDRTLDQLQLQNLVYIAHGWCLAFHDQPLTGDRPEAWEFGPMYRRLADSLASYGRQPVTREILNSEAGSSGARDSDGPARTDLEQSEADLIEEIYEHFGSLKAEQLSALTRKGATPWTQVYADGTGRTHDIPHNLVKAQFVELVRKSEKAQDER